MSNREKLASNCFIRDALLTRAGEQRVNFETKPIYVHYFPKSHVTDKSGGLIAATAIDHLPEILNCKITDYSTNFLVWISPHLPHMPAITGAEVVYKYEHTVIAEAIQRVVS